MTLAFYILYTILYHAHCARITLHPFQSEPECIIKYNTSTTSCPRVPSSKLSGIIALSTQWRRYYSIVITRYQVGVLRTFAPSGGGRVDICMQDTFARAKHSAYAAARPSARATIGYLVYKVDIRCIPLFELVR